MLMNQLAPSMFTKMYQKILRVKHVNDQIWLQFLLENMYTWQEVQHTCYAAKKYMQHSLFVNKLQNVNLGYGYLLQT